MALGILGMGGHAPLRGITNAQTTGWSGVDDDWIIERTGIHQRRYTPPGTTTSDLALKAANDALSAEPDALRRLGLIVVATSTPDRPQSSTGAMLQNKLGLSGVPAFDVNAVCSGFIYALAVVESMLSARLGGQYGLVVGADTYSALMNRSEHTAGLLSDGAGAALLGPVPDGYGLHAWRLVTDGENRDYAEVVAGGTRRPVEAAARAEGTRLFRTRGRPVRDYALHTVPKLIGETLDAAGLRLEDIDRIILHQANTRLVDECVRELGVDPARVPLTAPYYGNTAAASVPLTMRIEHRRCPFRRGTRLVLAGVGGGMTAGAAVLTWY